jgi:hypothetical protein
MTVDTPLLQAIARAFHDLTLADARAAELALELDRLDRAIRATAASGLDLDSDPTACAAVLDRGAR